jgi:hypothetical protein
MYKSFIESLPEKVRSTDYFEEGTKFRNKEKALRHKYVELHQLYKKYIALDIDASGSAYRWDERGLPPPSYVVVNPVNAHCHYLYELRVPVYYTEHARRAPQKFYENTDIALTGLLEADTAFVGHLVKNPLHPYWKTICHNAAYDLEDFKDYGVDLRGHKQKQAVRHSIEGRNSTLFETLRHWAYIEVQQHTSYTGFYEAVDNKALSINGIFIDCPNGILPAKEVLSTSKSVGTWTWRHRFTIGNQKNRGVLGLDEDMPLSEKQAQGAAYANLMRSEAVDDKIKQAIHKCKERGLSLTSGNLEKCGLAGSTCRKHREAANNWIRLLA